MPTVNLSVELVNALMQYLASRPYNEVAGLIDAVRTQAAQQAQASQQPQGEADASAAGTD